MPLSVLIWLPLAATLVAALLPRRVAPRVALGAGLATLVSVSGGIATSSEYWPAPRTRRRSSKRGIGRPI